MFLRKAFQRKWILTTLLVLAGIGSYAAFAQLFGAKPDYGVAQQNIQARIRGQRMWNWANSSGALFLQTGDMSEKAVGYTTIGGDLEGALSVIANVPKTVVNALLDNSGNPISNPETADRGGYTDFCGYLCSCSSSTEGNGHENIN